MRTLPKAVRLKRKWMMNIFKFGILGCGLISQIHAEAIKEIDGAVVYGAFDSNENAKKDFCEKYSIKAFESAEELILCKDIDAVCICLPSGLHYSYALKCIAYKKHVVIEKPMALTSAQAQDIVQTAKKQGVYVSVISQLRYSNAVREVKRIIDSGKLGTITLGNAIMKYWRDEEYYKASKWHGTWEMDGGGALMNQGIHGVDLLQYLLGGVVSVCAHAKTLVHDIETEDTLTAILEYENGAIGTIQATTSVYPGYSRRIEIHGSKGSMVLCEDKIEISDVEGEEHICCKENSVYSAASRPDGINCVLHAKQFSDFIESVSNGKKPFIDAVEGKKSVDIICAIYKSAKTGEKVYL